MWLTSGRASGRKTLLQYSSLTPLERECYEEEVQPYRKTDYKPIIYKRHRLQALELSQTHVLTLSPVPTGLVEPQPNPIMRSPPTPPRSKHMCNT